MILKLNRFLLIIPALLFLIGNAPGQEVRPTPSPSPESPTQDEQEAVRILTEEVQLTVTALDGRDHLDPTLELADVLVLEDGVAQEIRSARRVPAHVLLLLDTGGELNSAKRVRLTREIARRLVLALGAQDEISVMQFNSKIDVLQNWTIDKDAVLHVLDTKLISGKRARFFEAVIASAAQLHDRPQGNRHVVMITDGVQSPGERVDRAAAFAQLQASNAVVHVISYTSVSGQVMDHQARRKRNRDKSIVPDDAVNSIGRDERRKDDAVNSIGGDEGRLAQRAHQPGGFIIDLDPERRRQIKAYKEAMKLSEKELARFSEESGGRIWLPETFPEMIDDGTEAARLIDSQYVVTYKPRRALASAREGEVRRIDVASRRVGLKLISRRLYVVPANAPLGDGRARKVMN
jgi:VWFA-related protein